MVSIIVPAYNAEQYIDKCIDSLIHQTYSDIQIIVIDDGSKDNTWSRLSEWAVKDNRILALHYGNAGVVTTRQRGLDHATGEMLMFVDADDYLPLDSVETLVAAMGTSDIAVGGYTLVWAQNPSANGQQARSGDTLVAEHPQVQNPSTNGQQARGGAFRLRTSANQGHFVRHQARGGAFRLRTSARQGHFVQQQARGGDFSHRTTDTPVLHPKRFTTPNQCAAYCLRYGETFLPIKLFRTDLFRRAVKIPNDICVQEDTIGTLQYLAACGSVSHTDKSIYYYIKHGDSASYNLSPRHLNSLLKVATMLCGMYSACDDADLLAEVKNSCLKNIFTYTKLTAPEDLDKDSVKKILHFIERPAILLESDSHQPAILLDSPRFSSSVLENSRESSKILESSQESSKRVEEIRGGSKIILSSRPSKLNYKLLSIKTVLKHPSAGRLMFQAYDTFTEIKKKTKACLRNLIK